MAFAPNSDYIVHVLKLGLYFEISKLYTDKANQERLVIAGLVSIRRELEEETIDLDFYALKGCL